jgi:hypothetical protein
MGSIQDLLQEVPLAAVLRERVALADQKYEATLRDVEQLQRKVAALEKENAELRAQIPQTNSANLSDDTNRVLVQIFRAKEQEESDVGVMASALGMERGVMQYHLDLLQEAGLAWSIGGNYLHGHTYWGLKPEGRQRVIEGKLI